MHETDHEALQDNRSSEDKSGTDPVDAVRSHVHEEASSSAEPLKEKHREKERGAPKAQAVEEMSTSSTTAWLGQLPADASTCDPVGSTQPLPVSSH